MKIILIDGKKYVELKEVKATLRYGLRPDDKELFPLYDELIKDIEAILK